MVKWLLCNDLYHRVSRYTTLYHIKPHKYVSDVNWPTCDGTMVSWLLLSEL